ncbi:MAG: hypothetical protein K2Q23_11745 [Bryobacteraceae bacterium]|nr:hypothetical protein [Bryobacteraceae bacterium]
MWTLAKKFAGAVLPGVIKPLQVLWNEIIGFIFLVFAIVILGSTVRKILNFDGSPQNLFVLILSLFFCVLMGGYGIHAFLRARKISRS